MQGLEGVKVLELGNMVSAAYATKLMADLGAEVTKVEEPRGDRARLRGPFPGGVVDPEKSGLFLYLNTNKRDCTIDLPKDRDTLAGLVSQTDILIHNYSPAEMTTFGIDYRTFREINPQLVMCSITPFGLSGPHQDYQATELTFAHGGGWAWLSPGGSDRPDLPPLKAFGHQCGLQAGLHAATVTLAAYFRTLANGVGEHIDLSTHASVASFVEMNVYFYSYLGKIASRLGRKILAPLSIYECQDGSILLLTAQPDQLERLLEFMGNPEWSKPDYCKNPFTIVRHWDEVEPHLRAWIKQWKVADLFREAQARRICVAPVCTMADLAAQEQLQARKFFVEVNHPRAGKVKHPGAPYQLAEQWWSIRRPAPLLGEHNEDKNGAGGWGLGAGRPSSPSPKSQAPSPKLPLEGVRVLALTWAWAGPYGAMQLAHLGAEVIHIESRARPDGSRQVPISPKDIKASLNTSGYFNQWNQGTKSISLNLTKPEALAVAKKLIATCDVVIQNFATGVMERLGLGYEDLKKIKPDIILASISGYGQTGPQRLYMGYGPAMGPLSGLSSLTGYIGGSPQEVGMAYGDPNGGVNAAIGVCAALAARKRTGRGQHIDVSLWESMTALVAEGWMDYAMNGTQPPRMGNRDPIMAPHNCFRCAGQDEWVAISCASDADWQSLCRVMGQEQLLTDERFSTAKARKANEDALEQIVTAWTSTQEKWTVAHRLQADGIAAYPTLSSQGMLEDPQLNERGFFVRLPHAEVGAQAHAGMPWKFTNAPNGVRAPAPLLGQDTDSVLHDLLGYSTDEIAQMKETKVLY